MALEQRSKTLRSLKELPDSTLLAAGTGDRSLSSDTPYSPW